MPYFLLVLKAMFSSNHTTDSLSTVKKRLSRKEAILLDVREPEEWDEGHLEAARLVPLSQLRDGQKRVDATKDLDKNDIVYCHCRSGKRVFIATHYLSREGFDVRPLKAGYKDLLTEGFEGSSPE